MSARRYYVDGLQALDDQALEVMPVGEQRFLWLISANEDDNLIVHSRYLTGAFETAHQGYDKSWMCVAWKTKGGHWNSCWTKRESLIPLIGPNNDVEGEWSK